MYNDNYPNEFHQDTDQQKVNQGAEGASAEQGGQTGGAYGTNQQGGQDGSAYGANQTSGQAGTNGQQTGDDRGGWHNESRDRYAGSAQGGWQNESRSAYGSNQQAGGTNQNYYDRYRSNGQNQNGYGQNAQGQSGHGQSGQNGQNGYGSQNGYTGQGNYSGANQYQNGWQPGQGGNHGGHSPKKKGKGPKIAVAVALAAVFVAVCLGISWFAVDSIKSSLTASSQEVQNQEVIVEQETEAKIAEESAESEAQVSSAATVQESGQVVAVVTDVTDVVEKVMPACVSITNLSTQELQNFWGQTYSQDSEASGSGIIIGQNDTELLIVTNNHVVEDADTLTVQFIDSQTVPALVKGTDATVDLAVIAVKFSDISEETLNEICVAQMGDSDSLKIGEPAIAIGNALGYGQSVTTGVISALNRTLEVSETGSSNALIQTDAAINPGNSGGALLNIKGEVIGINSSKIGDSLVEGMGYAIPISTAKPIIEDLMSKETKEKVAEDERGYLGISCINVTSDIASNFNMPEGVFVAQVYEGTGADKAGLVRGDIITAFDGTEVKNQTELTALTQYYKAGETVEITIMQGSANGYQAKNVEITLSSIDEMNSAAEAQQQQQQQQKQQSTPGYRMP